MYITKRYITRCTCRLSTLLGVIIVVVFLRTIVVHDCLKKLSTKREILSGIRQFNTKEKRRVSYENIVTPIVRAEGVNCKAIINNSQVEINRTLRLMNVTKKRILIPHYYLRKTKNCSKFLNERKYISKALTREEAEFPIAYSIMIYKDIEQFERLLRAIYRPQNYYCIHVDRKSPKIFHLSVQGILACFSNVFMASSLVDVRWGEFTALEADLICMKDLWKRYKSWKYFINLTGQEFPLRTNNELVEVLRTYNGTADIKKTALFANISKGLQDRIHYKHRNGKKTKHKLRPLPYDLSLTKGQCHAVMPRSFVDYILRSWVAKDFLEWLRNTGVPDETYFQTLNYSPQLNIPGSYTGYRPRNARYKNWRLFPCYGKIVRGICIHGVGDLHYITKQPQFFVNKFHLDFQYLTLDCMEEWFYNRTRAYYQGDMFFDVTPYIYHENGTTPNQTLIKS